MMRSKRAAIPIVALISLLAAMITLLSFAGVIDTASIFKLASISGSGDYIERPVFYYDKCEAISSYKYSTDYDVATDGNWINRPSVTDSYDVFFEGQDSSLLGSRYIEYSICNSKTLSNENNCRIYSKKVKLSTLYTGGTLYYEINNVGNDEYVWIQYQRGGGSGYTAQSGATYYIGWTPYGINRYNVLGGSSSAVSTSSCTYSSTQYDTILSTNADAVNSYYSGVDDSTNQKVLQPEEVRWYVAGYLTSAAPSFTLTYKGKDAWCRDTGSGGEIYEINTITTNGGTYKIASADWSDYLGSVDCCPGETQGDDVCNDDFEFEQLAGSECGLFNSCGSADWTPLNSGTIIKYSCNNGFCESETQEVECASDSDCSDSNQVCDESTWECVDANVNLQGQVIETIPDNEQECEDKGGTWYSEQSKECSLLNYLGVGECDVIVVEYCELGSGINWTLWIIVIIGIGSVYLFRGELYGILRGLLGRVGIRI